MKLFTNIQVWIWVLTTLLVINMAITGSILWHQHRRPDFPSALHDQQRMTERKNHPMGSKQWKERMKFTPEQWQKLEAGRNDFFRISEPIVKMLDENQQALFIELNKESPDMLWLDSLAEESGFLHTQLRKESVRHLISVKEITTPEQYEKMSEMMKHWMFPGHLRPGLQGPPIHGRQGQMFLRKDRNPDTCLKKHNKSENN